ncbi:hypothetical protein RSAG8_09645, partial [Rhizoctonia solani AG-8 WAC10335]
MDIDFFGRDLADLSISGAFKASRPPLYGGDSISPDKGRNDKEYEEDEDEEDKGPPGDPDDDVEQDDGRQIQVPPDDPEGAPGDPGGDGARLDIPVLEEHPMLHNIYLRMWVHLHS